MRRLNEWLRDAPRWKRLCVGGAILVIGYAAVISFGVALGQSVKPILVQAALFTAIAFAVPPLVQRGMHRERSRVSRMEWNPISESLHRVVEGDREFLVWSEPDAWGWAVINLGGPPETTAVMATGEAPTEDEAKAKAEAHAGPLSFG